MATRLAIKVTIKDVRTLRLSTKSPMLIEAFVDSEKPTVNQACCHSNTLESPWIRGMAMPKETRKDPIKETIEMPAETAPLLWVTKEINRNESNGRKIMTGQYCATPSRACAPGAADARYVQALIPKSFIRFSSAVGDSTTEGPELSHRGVDGQAFAFWVGVPFLQKLGRFL